MKITIELTISEVAGIKNYLKQFESGRITKEHIRSEVQGIVTGVLHAQQEAVSDYINIIEMKEHTKVKTAKRGNVLS